MGEWVVRETRLHSIGREQNDAKALSGDSGLKPVVSFRFRCLKILCVDGLMIENEL